MSLIHVIKSSPLFLELYEEEVDGLIKDCHVRYLEAGEELFHENDKGDDMFIVINGELAIVKGGIEITRFAKGELLGELVLINDVPRTTSCVATHHSEILIINNKIIFSTFNTNPRTFSILMMNIARMLAQRLRKTTVEMKELTEKLQKVG